MLNLSPTNGEENCDEVTVESASEDDEIDISQFVESVLEEPPEPPRASVPQLAVSQPPTLLYFRNPTNQGIYQRPTRPIQQVISPLRPTRPAFAVPSGLRPIRPIQTVQYAVPIQAVPIQNISQGNPLGKTVLFKSQPPVPRPTASPANITWLKDCVTKLRTSSNTLSQQVTAIEERFKSFSRGTDSRRVTSLANDVEALLKQTELGYKYLGSELTAAHRKWAENVRRQTMINGSQDVLVRQQVVLPQPPANNVLASLTNIKSLPQNMQISVNGNNHILSVTLEHKPKQRSDEELCAEHGIKPCFVKVERCDQDSDANNDDVEIIEELIAL